MLHEMMNREANARNPQPERRNENRRQKEQRRIANDEGRHGGKGDRIPAPERQLRHFDSRNNGPETTPDSLPPSRRHQKTPETWPGENFQSGTSQAQKAEGQTPQQQTVPAERHEQNGNATAAYSEGSARKERIAVRGKGSLGRASGRMRKPYFSRTHEQRERMDGGKKSMRASGGSNTVFRSFKDRNASPNEPTQGESRRGSRATSEPGDRRSRFDRTVNNRGEKDFGESHDRPFGERNRGAGGKIDSTQRDMGQTGQNMKGGRGGEIHQQQGPYGPPGKRRGPQAAGKPLMDDWGKSDKH